MSSKTEVAPDLDEVVNTLPPVICNNPRKKIDAEEVNPNELKPRSKEPIRSDGLLVDYTYPESPAPVPKFPLSIEWQPSQLSIELEDAPVVNVLSVWNECPRTIYIHCCGFWGDTARLGASWYCRPKTRFHLAPGMSSRLVVTVTPRNQSPVPLANAGLQISVAHMRDHVVAYFVVPIEVKFLNYKPPAPSEGE